MTVIELPNRGTVYGDMLAEDIIEIISNDRPVYETIVGTLHEINQRTRGGDPRAFGELIRELIVRLYRRQGVDPDRERTTVDRLTLRLLSMADWVSVGEHFAGVANET